MVAVWAVRAAAAPFGFSLPLPKDADPSNLAVVVFVQDNQTKHVLQAGFVDLSLPMERRITEMEASGVHEAK